MGKKKAKRKKRPGGQTQAAEVALGSRSASLQRSGGGTRKAFPGPAGARSAEKRSRLKPAVERLTAFAAGRFTLVAVVFILGLAAAVYAHSLDNEFTNWDDENLVVNNYLITSLNPTHLKWMFTPFEGSTYQPIRLLSYALTYHFWGLNPVGFHLDNIILHGLGAVFLFLSLVHALPQIKGVDQQAAASEQPFDRLRAGRQQGASGVARGPAVKEPMEQSRKKRSRESKRKTKSAGTKPQESISDNPSTHIPHLTSHIADYRFIALLTALLFAVHPVNVESVAWVSGRKFLLAGFFGFLSFYLLVKSSAGGKYRPIPAILSFVAWVLAVLSSPVAAVLPVLFLLFDYCRDNSSNPLLVLRRRLGYYVPYVFLGVLLIPIMWYSVMGRGVGGAVKEHAAGNPLYTLLTMLRVLFDYARNLVLPFWLNTRYPDHVSTSMLDVKVLVALVALLALLAFVCLRLRAGSKVHLFCTGWVFLCWLPVSNIIPISTKMADRYLYLPAVGVFLWFAIAWWRFSSLGAAARGRTTAPRSLFATLLAVAILVSLSYGAIQRNRVWANSATLWEDSLAKDARNPLAHYNLGQTLSGQDRYREAITHYREAVGLKPDYVDAHINLGVALAETGEKERAMEHYRQAVELEPDNFEAQYNLGNALFEGGEPEEAAAHLREAIRLFPYHAEAHFNLGVVLLAQGKLDQAAAEYRLASQHKPDFPEAHGSLALVLSLQGKNEEAREHLSKASRLDPTLLERRGDLKAVAERLGERGGN
jgi:tetratricopeptide (TPR) repeat protein